MKNVIKIILLSLIFLSSCTENKKIRFATGPAGTSYYDVGTPMTGLLKDIMNIDIQVITDSIAIANKVYLPSSINNCYFITEHAADLAITQNDISSSQKLTIDITSLRSVLPLYPTVFFLIYKKEIKPKSLKQLLVGRRVAMGPHDSGTAQLAKRLLQEFGVDTTMYIPFYTTFNNNRISDSIDVCCALTGFNNSRISDMLETGGEIYSFGNYELMGKGSSIDGFCLKFPTYKPFIIPNNFYNDLKLFYHTNQPL